MKEAGVVGVAHSHRTRWLRLWPLIVLVIGLVVWFRAVCVGWFCLDAVLFEPVLAAGPELAQALSSKMVLQRAPRRARVWGRSSSASVQVRLRDAQGEMVWSGAARVESGTKEWQVELAPQEAGVGFSLEIQDASGSVELSDVAFGDVFLCGGQSNMEMSVNADQGGKEAIVEASTFVNLRFFITVRAGKNSTQFDVPSRMPQQRWVASSEPGAFGENDMFSYPSAVCYFFARDLYTRFEGKIPVGFVGSYYGGTFIEEWSSPDAMADQSCGGLGPQSRSKEAKIFQKLSQQAEPHHLWYGQITPFLKMDFLAILWYQGENNSGDATGYACRFPAMIVDWRRKFGQDLPFFFVQLAGYVSNFEKLRQAQMHALRLPKVGFAAAIDIGHPTDIHPVHKQEVSRRLTVAAVSDLYGIPVVSKTGPTLATVQALSGGGLIVTYVNGTAHKLSQGPTKSCQACCKESPFEITLDGLTWTQVPFLIKNDSYVVLSYPEGGHPSAVRYAWEGFPQCSLYSNFEGLSGTLPATPFVYPMMI